MAHPTKLMIREAKRARQQALVSYFAGLKEFEKRQPEFIAYGRDVGDNAFRNSLSNSMAKRAANEAKFR